MVYEPTAPELQADASTQAAMDRGSRVGEIARNYVPGGIAITLPYNAYDERIVLTRQLIAHGAPAVYEASFRAGGTFEILRWVLGWGDAAEVVRPAALRKQVRRAVRQMGRLYEKS
jgi:predicted DNA-binding transcriptional regulator YafY